MKKTYKNQLPKNMEVSSTNVRVENGEVIVEVEFKEKFEPKDGDFLSDEYDNVFIYKKSKPLFDTSYCCYCGINISKEIEDIPSNNWTPSKGCRYATSKEKSAFLERLKKECNRRWNAEKKCLEYIYQFGDIVKVTFRGCRGFKRDYMICIYPNKDFSEEDNFFNLPFLSLNGKLVLDDTGGSMFCKSITPASAKEKQELFDKLAEAGKRWNPETKQLEDIRWRAKEGDKYFVVNDLLNILSYKDYNNKSDNELYKIGNYFRTPEAALKAANQIKEIFKNSKAE